MVCTLTGIPAGDGNLTWHRKQVDQQHAREGRHLVGIFFIGCRQFVDCVIAVQTKPVSPLLQRRGDKSFGGKLVNAFFQFPRLNIWRKPLQCHFHGASEHGASGSVKPDISCLHSFKIGNFRLFRDVVWRGDGFRFWESGYPVKVRNNAPISDVSFEVYHAIRGASDHSTDRLIAGSADAKEVKPCRSLGLTNNLKRAICSSAVRAILDDNCHA